MNGQVEARKKGRGRGEQWRREEGGQATEDLQWQSFTSGNTPVKISHLLRSVADPHHLDADPDAARHFDADPDPPFNFDGDPDSSSPLKAQNLEKTAQIGSYSIRFGLSSAI